MLEVFCNKGGIVTFLFRDIYLGLSRNRIHDFGMHRVSLKILPEVLFALLVLISSASEPVFKIVPLLLPL
jgi:hypothetical protein